MKILFLNNAILAKCLGFSTALGHFDDADRPWSIGLDYYVDSLEPNPGLEVFKDYQVYFASPISTKGWDTDSYGSGIKTVTFTEEQEVSAEFYTWFTANAVKVSD